MSQRVFEVLGEDNYQSPDVVARSAVLCMADQTRNGDLIYSNVGKYIELENGDNGFQNLAKKMLSPNGEALPQVPDFGRAAK